MKIFFSAAIRAGRELQPHYARIVELLSKYGEVSGTHIMDDTLPRQGETEISEQEIFSREMDNLKSCDILIAEVTTPSLGVGYLIGQSVAMEKRTVCLYHGEDRYHVSAMIKGNAQVEVYRYARLEELEDICARIFAK